PELAAELAHAILDVELFAAVARPRQREPRQRAGGFHAAKLVFVEEVVVAALMAEEQPIATGRFARHAVMEKRAERRDADAGPDHDDGRRWIRRKTEVLRLLDVDFDLVAGARPLAEEGGGNAEPLAPIDRIAHCVDAQRHSVSIDLWRASNGIEPRLQRVERLDQRFRIGPHAGKLLDRGEHVE